MKKLARWEVYESLAHWRIRLVAPNGEIICSGEGYTTRAKARAGIRAIRKYANAEITNADA